MYTLRKNVILSSNGQKRRGILFGVQPTHNLGSNGQERHGMQIVSRLALELWFPETYITW